MIQTFVLTFSVNNLPFSFLFKMDQVFNLLQTCLTDEPFFLVTLRSFPSSCLSTGRHVDAILVPAVARWFIDIPVGVFTRTIICPKEAAFHMLVIKANPEIVVLSQKHSCQKCLFVSAT